MWNVHCHRLLGKDFRSNRSFQNHAYSWRTSLTHWFSTHISDRYLESHLNSPSWLSQDLADDKSILVQVVAWSRHATIHCLGQCWPRPMSPCGVTRPQEKHQSMINLDKQTDKLRRKYIHLLLWEIFRIFVMYLVQLNHQYTAPVYI